MAKTLFDLLLIIVTIVRVKGANETATCPMPINEEVRRRWAVLKTYLYADKEMPLNSPGVGDKAGPLRYTSSYVYNIADCLGKGATASVYLGRERKNGKQVAIKVFSDRGSRQITQARIRETELLATVKHRNVMRLIASETEIDSGNHVIVLPYCQGGSVYTLLEQPENGFGFQEKEFLRFLNDISSGLKFLNQKGIIHRDIKPGNILKGVEEDGGSVYILTDFGAARELGEEETFMSIYGTEEYIHPDMFQRAVLRQPGQTQFTSSVDLWSLAVTIYHVATGKLPFQAYGGRNDSHMMFEIMSGRQSGEISGIQRQSGGPVERSKHLPDTCYLSKELRRKMEPILAGLVEVDATKAMTFDQYFNAVNDVINLKTMKVFFAQTGTQMLLYLQKTDCYIHIQEKIASITEIPAERQLLLLGHTQLKDIVESNEQIQTYPKSVQNAQLFLFEKENYDSYRILLSELPPFPSFSVSSSLSSDSSVSKQCAGVAYYIEWKTKEVKMIQNLLLDAKLYLRLFVQQVLIPIDKVALELDKEVSLTRKRSDCIQLSQANVLNFVKMIELFQLRTDLVKKIKTAVITFSSEDDYVMDIMSKTNKRCEEIKLYISVLGQKLRECATPSPTDHMGCHEEDHCLSKVEHLRLGVQTVSSTFSKHKKYGELHPHEVFIHKVERQKLEDVCVNIISLYQSHCVDNLKRVHTAVNKQLSILLRHLTRVGKVEVNIQCVVECQGQINEKLDRMDKQYENVSELLKSNVKDILRDPSTITKASHREPPEFTETSSRTASGKAQEKADLMKRLFEEVDKLESERSELDTMMDKNTQSLLEIRQMLQDTSRLSLTSFQNEKKSVECSEPSDPNTASGFS